MCLAHFLASKTAVFRLGLAGSLCAALGVAASSAAAQDAELAAPALTIGSPAPPIDVEHWLSDGQGKFAPVKEFEPGKVYVVEFWATWCGPCVASMPHLAQLQTEYRDQGVQVVSVSDEPLETVTEFLAKPVRGATPAEAAEGEEPQIATYAELTSAYCLTTDPDRSVHVDYMEAAAQRGIPTAFLVGKTGAVEWIGHPMQMDEPLAKVVNDQWDREEYAAGFLREQQRAALQQRLMQIVAAGAREAQAEAGDATTGAQMWPERIKAGIAKAREEAGDDAELQAWLDTTEAGLIPQMAMMLEMAGKRDEATAAWEAALPHMQPAAVRRAQAQRMGLLLRNKDYDRLAPMLAEFVADQENEPTMLWVLARQFQRLADDGTELPQPLLQAALSAAERAVAADETNVGAAETRLWLTYRAGDKDRALSLAQEAADQGGAAAAMAKQFLEKTAEAEPTR